MQNGTTASTNDSSITQITQQCPDTHNIRHSNTMSGQIVSRKILFSTLLQ